MVQNTTHVVLTPSAWSQSLRLCPSNSSQVIRQYPSLISLPERQEKLPLIREEVAADYLKKKGGYTKNFRTGVCLCQCGNLYDVEVTQAAVILEQGVQAEIVSYTRAKCRPINHEENTPVLSFICND